MKNIILTGDRPTGQLHIGHFIGSLKNRVLLQNKGDYDKMYIMIADAQALTDNFDNVDKVKDNILQVMLDYLAVGLDPEKVVFFIQSEIPELTEFTFFYMNLVTFARLQRNPTVKAEISQKKFNKNIPMGFLCYPISQTADITAFNANIVPVGVDQLPMIEQAREICRTFNNIYKTDLLIEPQAVIPENKVAQRLPGLDGAEKMSKSLGNCIFLADEPEVVKQKIFSMYTDPNHIKISDPGQTRGNVVFAYLDAFSEKEHFERYLPEYKNLEELKAHYKKGGLGDVKIKTFLNNILQEILKPIREKRKTLEKNPARVFEILFKGSDEAKKDAEQNILKLKQAMGIDYRNNLKNKN
ncbi:MAG: tryptophan--tRNA ligase [Clostridia bacterium]|nr:tryptophan--tRNA ligase [Clostridia bacterium]